MRSVGQLVVPFIAVLAVSFLGGQGLAAAEHLQAARFGIGAATAVLAVLAYRWTVTLMERRPRPAETELGGAASGLVRGALLGAALFGMIITNFAASGYYHVHGLGSLPNAGGLVGFMLAAAATEELMYRGVLFRIVEKWTGTWLALLISSLVFGATHLLNADAGTWGALAVAIEGGGMLTAAYIATRKMWLPIGLHFGWNYAGAGIFSSEISGNGANSGILNATTHGPKIITGGAFGPEGSIFALLFCTLAACAFLWLAKRRGRLVPMRRSDRRPAAEPAEQPAEAATLTR